MPKANTLSRRESPHPDSHTKRVTVTRQQNGTWKQRRLLFVGAAWQKTISHAQSCRSVITLGYALTTLVAFYVKINLFLVLLESCSLGNFCVRRLLSSTNSSCCHELLSQALSSPSRCGQDRDLLGFGHRQSDFEEQRSNFELLRTPFALPVVETEPAQIQMELS